MSSKSFLLFLFILNFHFTFSQDLNLNILTIPDSLKKDASSVVRFYDTDIDIVSHKKMIIKVKKAVTVLNKIGDGNKYVRIAFDKNRKIKKYKVLVYDSQGNEIKKVKNKEFVNVSAISDISLYEDSRMLIYRHIPLSYPYTIFYEFEVETSNTFFIPKWYPIDSYDTGLMSSNFKTRYSEKLDIQIIENNFNQFNIQKNNNENLISYSLNNVKPIKNEPLSPSLKEISPSVKLASNHFFVEGISGKAANWKELGKWEYENFYKEVGELPNSTKEAVKKLVAGIESPIEKAKIIYKYVQDRTRYISVQVGIGGLKPMLAEDVDKLGYGDCKALTNYTKSLLDAVGVQSYFTELYGGYEKLNMDFNSPNIQGNHVILNLPNEVEDIWLECTSQKVPFGHIANFTDDRDVIVIKPDGGELKHTKKYGIKDNLQFTKGNYIVDNNGNIKAKVVIESSGSQYSDNLLISEGKSPRDLDILFKRYLSNINNIKFSGIKLANNKDENKFEEYLDFTATDYASFIGDQMLIPINAFNKNLNIPKRVRNRKLPFEILRGYIDIDEIKIKIPLEFIVDYLPENIEINTKFGKYSSEITKIDDNTYTYKRKLQVKEGKYLKEDYESYRRFKKQVAKFDKTKIILQKK